MKDFDLRQAIQLSDIAEKLFCQSMRAAMAIKEGKNVKVLSPDEDSAKEFMAQVKKRIEEHDCLFGAHRLLA